MFEISEYLDLSHTIAAPLFEGKQYPWEVLPEISEFIKKIGPTLDPEVNEQKGEISGSQRALLYSIRLISRDPASSDPRQR